MNNSIQHIVESGFCNGCCNCISACTENNITFIRSKKFGHPVPNVDTACTGCGNCLKVCKSATMLYNETVS